MDGEQGQGGDSRSGERARGQSQEKGDGDLGEGTGDLGQAG